MRKLTRSLLASTAVLSLMAIPTVAIGAPPQNEVSFTLTSDANAIAIDNSGGAWTQSSGVLGALTAGTVSGTLPETTVTDNRGTPGNWAVQVIASGDWVNTTLRDADPDGDGVIDGTDTNGDGVVNDSDLVTIPASAGHAHMGVADLNNIGDSVSTVLGVTSGMTVDNAELSTGTSNNLGGSYTLIEGSSLLGNGEITYTPTVDITVPNDATAGTYTTEVVQSLS